MLTKRAQSTAFFIVGLLVLASAVAIYAFKEFSSRSEAGRQVQRATILPEKIEKVNAYVESCIRQQIDRGATILGAQGGYAIIPEDSQPRSPVNLFSTSLDVFNTGLIQVPYWFYETANGIQNIMIPTMGDLEQSLANNIDASIQGCINEFVAFKQEGYLIRSGDPTTTIAIGQENIVARVKYAIVIDVDDLFYTLSEFEITQPSGLGKLYTQAVSIMEKEDKDQFIENYALDMMVIYDEIPFSGIDMECTPKTWIKSEVAENMKDILATNIPSIKIEDTKYESSEDRYFEVETETANEDLTVNMQYSQNWPFVMDVVGEKGEVLKGKPFTTGHGASRFLASLFCLNDYHFVYDVKFPVLVTLTTESDELFQFAVEAIIDNNQPRINTAEAQTIELDSPICDHPSTPMNLLAQGIDEKNSLRSLPQTRLSYKCGVAVCDIGMTENDGTLSAMLPACLNGFLLAEREGYLEAKAELSTTESSAASIILEPLYEIPVEVRVIDTTGAIRPLQPTEQAIFTLTREGERYATTIIAPGTSSVRLAAGTYAGETSLLVTNEGGFTLEEKEIKTCVDVPRQGVFGVVGLKEKKCQTHTIEGTTVDQVTAGKATFSWDLSRQAAASANLVTLYTVRGKTPRTVEDLMTSDEETRRNSQIIRTPEVS